MDAAGAGGTRRRAGARGVYSTRDEGKRKRGSEGSSPRRHTKARRWIRSSRLAGLEGEAAESEVEEGLGGEFAVLLGSAPVRFVDVSDGSWWSSRGRWCGRGDEVGDEVRVVVVRRGLGGNEVRVVVVLRRRWC